MELRMVQESRHGRVTIEKEPEISTDVMVSSLSRVDHDLSGRKITFENITVLVNSRNPIIIDQHYNRNGMGNDSAIQISDVTYGTGHFLLPFLPLNFLLDIFSIILKKGSKARYDNSDVSDKRSIFSITRTQLLSCV